MGEKSVCPSFPDLLQYAAKSDITEELRLQIVRHLGVCDSCRESLAAMNTWLAERTAEARRIFDLPFDQLETELDRMIKEDDATGSTALVDRLIEEVESRRGNFFITLRLLDRAAVQAPGVARPNAADFLRSFFERMRRTGLLFREV
ncbi:hypothetical protein HY771_00175 [Candidatus Uhrbacteria bacterium]|nr:hypothetical protein [Candidatus Uhrbacteria bacterium]